MRASTLLYFLRDVTVIAGFACIVFAAGTALVFL